MKKIIISFCAVLLAASTLLPFIVSAQSPSRISYQAVIRNSENKLVSDKTIGMQISILQGTADGVMVYIETHTPNTNANGLATIEIGGGESSYNFSAINWANGPYFVKVETDPEGGTNYTISGTSQLLSVPYAMYAQTAEALVNPVQEIDPAFTAWDKSTGIVITEE